MPYSIEPSQTASELRITRLTLSGVVTEGEAGQLMAELSPGGVHSGIPMLVLTDASTEIGAAARRIFTSNADKGAEAVLAAVVTQSVVFRITVNFIGRVNGNNA